MSGRKADSAAMLPPWPLTISTRLEAVPLDALQEAEQHRAIGRDVEREGAAEGHVMLGHAAPQRRRHHDRGIGGDRLGGAPGTRPRSGWCRRRRADAGPCCSIDATGSTTIAPACALSREIGRGELLPHHGLRHQRASSRGGNGSPPHKGEGDLAALAARAVRKIISTSPCARCSGTGWRSGQSPSPSGSPTAPPSCRGRRRGGRRRTPCRPASRWPWRDRRRSWRR